MASAVASRPGPRARSRRFVVPRRASISAMPSKGSSALSSTPAPTPAASLLTLHMREVP